MAGQEAGCDVQVPWRHLETGLLWFYHSSHRSEGAHPMAADLLQTVQALVTEKQAILMREEELVTGLRQVLDHLGYQLEAITSNGTSRPSGKASRSPSAHAASRALGPISCPECRRTFSLPLHLGRHMSVMHKGKRPSTPQPTSPRAESGSAPAAPAKTRARRRRMRRAARQAAARRMKAHWGERKTSQKGEVRASRDSRLSAAKAARPSHRRKTPRRPRQTAA
jgi:hypothetical protein